MTRRFIKTWALLLMTCCICCMGAGGQETPVQRVLDVQGRLADPDTGKPFPDGPHQLVFQMYDVPSGGVALWFEVQDVVMKGGVFDTRLGEDPNNPLNLPFDTQYWLAITYDWGGEMTPRIKLTCSPYSLHALNADTVDWLHASKTAAPNTLLALDDGAKFPPSVWQGPIELSGGPWIPLLKATNFNAQGLCGESHGLVGVEGIGYGAATGVSGSAELGTGGFFTSANGTALFALGRSNLEGPTLIDGIVEVNAGLEWQFQLYGNSYFDGPAYLMGGHGPHTNLYVDGAGLALTVAGDSALNGNLGVSGNTSLGSGLDVTGHTSIDDVVWIARDSYTNFLVDGWTRFTGSDVNIDNNLIVNRNVYITGDLEVGGNKNAVVPTSQGTKKVYAQESPESWFEDFGSGRLAEGGCTIELDPMFLETVTVDSDHPILVFITPTEPMGNFHVRKGDGSFTVVAEERGSQATFDWRVVAKRKGYEDVRMEAASRPSLGH